MSLFCVYVSVCIVFLFAPVVLCLEELELILDPVTGVGGCEFQLLRWSLPKRKNKRGKRKNQKGWRRNNILRWWWVGGGGGGAATERGSRVTLHQPGIGCHVCFHTQGVIHIQSCEASRTKQCMHKEYKMWTHCYYPIVKPLNTHGSVLYFNHCEIMCLHSNLNPSQPQLAINGCWHSHI